ncbi:YcjX family protein, partial [Acidisphaera rubrifaciens]|uniref:YcjX family protein n=1 Tax=Acidisphaera rubrifaciens TaxID=50715 RepID=UPI001F51D57C
MVPRAARADQTARPAGRRVGGRLMRLGDIFGSGPGLLPTLGAGRGRETLRVAVTGLARSGKTVFLTSLLANLLALGQGRDTLPGLTRAL